MASKTRLEARRVEAVESTAETISEVLTVVNRLDRKLNDIIKRLEALEKGDKK